MAAKKRRSNWYIYALTFGITFVLLGLLIWQLRGYLFPEKALETGLTGYSGSEFVPDSSYNTTTLYMLSENKGAAPDYYMLGNYRPSDNVLVFIPLKNAIGRNGYTLDSCYSSGGVQRVYSLIEEILGVKCSNYVKFDHASFVEFFDLVGETEVNVPSLLEYGDLLFPSGANMMDGEEMYSYLTFPDFKEGEDYRWVVFGSSISAFVNDHFRHLSTIDMQEYFNKILNITDTDLTFDTYTKLQPAFVYTASSGSDIAEYYIPYGESDASGLFVVAENCVNTIKDRLGMNE